MELTAYLTSVDKFDAIRRRGVDALFRDDFSDIDSVPAVTFGWYWDIVPFLIDDRGFNVDDVTHPILGGVHYSERPGTAFYDAELARRVCESMRWISASELRRRFDSRAIVAAGFGASLRDADDQRRAHTVEHVVELVLDLRRLYCRSSSGGDGVVLALG